MPLTNTDLDPVSLRQAYGTFPTGVVAIAALIDGVPVGLAASSFVPVSIDPPLVAFCVQNTSNTWPKFASASNIGVSVLGESHDVAVRTLASKTGDRFEGLTTETTPEGAIFIGGAGAWLDTSVTQEVPAGDHAIVLLQINALSVSTEIDPIVFHASKLRRLLED
ncbi:flavin reductase family protein [Actinomycetes bacterium M1A6_2h]